MTSDPLGRELSGASSPAELDARVESAFGALSDWLEAARRHEVLRRERWEDARQRSRHALQALMAAAVCALIVWAMIERSR